MKIDHKKGFIILGCLLILGMLIALFLVYEHFSDVASKWCTFGDSFNCGIVNKSPYSNLDGISYLMTMDLKLPVPYFYTVSKPFLLDLLTSNGFLGFLTLLLLFSMLIAWRRKSDFLFIKHGSIKRWIIGILGFGIVYGGYLFLIQHFILKTYCLFCLMLDLTMILSMATILLLENEVTK
ncbi:MAG: hypothetical protein EPN86_04905 [Nanoarchaeota archaeon]|nr:MAG: hypothetical protein EPN86_04905 [Nanoarchaeota archaeon]